MAVKNQKHHDAGQTFMQSVLAALPEEKRAAVLPLFQGDDVDGALELAGAGFMRQEDYSRQSNELGEKTKEVENHWNKLNTWHAGKKTDLEEVDALRLKVTELQVAAGTGNGDGAPKPGDVKPAAAMTRDELLTTIGLDPAKIVTADQLTEVVGNIERGMLSFYQQANPISIEHYQTFGEVLDVEAVFKHPQVQQIGFKAAYLDTHKDKFEAKALKEAEAHDKEVADAAVAEHIKENAGSMGFPIPGRSMPSGITSPLDNLEASMRTPAAPAAGTPPGVVAPVTAPGPGHTNLADDGALVDKAVEQFLQRAQELGRPVARI